MKTLLLMTLTLSYNLSAQELRPPTEEDLIKVSISLMEDSEEIMTKLPEKDCDANGTGGMSMEIKKSPVVAEETNELFCVCELEGLQGLKAPGEKKNLGAILGDYVGSELTANTVNDNALHGALQPFNLESKKRDDKGRSFGANLDYTLTGTEGELKLSLDSTGFGKYSQAGRGATNPDGSKDLVFRERNTLKLGLNKNFSYEDNSKTYLISELKFVNETDQGNLSRAAQEKWHRAARDMGLFNAIQYRYVKEEEDTNTIGAVMGVGKKWVSDLGNWKCQTTLEAKGGMSVSLKGKVSPEVSVHASERVSHTSLPWLALSSWIQASGGSQGKEFQSGVMVSAQKKFGTVTMETFIGIKKDVSEIDKRFATGGKPNSTYLLGVTIRH